MERRERLRRAGAALAWAALALGASRVPAAVRAVPALGALGGPLASVLAALAAAVALAWLLAGRRIAPAAAPRGPALGALSSAVFLVLGLHYAAGLRVSGDEPHYLLMAQSLWREGDLDLRDNFERGDYREYVPALPGPHYGAPRKGGRPYPAHSPGLPLLLAPAYALGGRAGCLLVLALAGAGLGLAVRALALAVSREERAALWAWAAAVGPPVVFYAFHVYTEVPSALALALALHLLLSSPGPARAGLAALLASALPWLHVKMIPAAVALGLVALLRLRHRALPAFALVAVLMAGTYVAYHEWIFGSPTPLALYGGLPQGLGARSPLRAAVGLLLDRSYGLLPTAPVFLLALPGLVLLAWRSWREVLPHALVGASVLAPILTWRMWWGGQCPPARFLVPLVPLLGVALAARLAGPARGLARWRWVLLALGVGLALFQTARPEAMLLLNRRDRPTRVWDALSPAGGTQLGRYLPSLVSEDPAEARVALVWGLGLGALLALDCLALRRDGIDRLFRGLGLPLTLLLLINVAVDAWARAG